MQFRARCGLLKERFFMSTPAPTYSSAPSQFPVEASSSAKRGHNSPHLAPSSEMLSTYPHDATEYSTDSCSNPKAMLSVGNPGDVGEVEMQDLMFTTKGATPGAILVQWNIKASKPGSAGIWGMHESLRINI